VKSASEIFAVGDEVTAAIKSIDTKSRKIRLSIKDYEAAAEGPAVHQYLNNRENIGSSLGKALADARLLDSDN
jgi:small subunit ribosomal protein S1